jgi:hypothetical protein
MAAQLPQLASPFGDANSLPRWRRRQEGLPLAGPRQLCE